MKGVPQGFVLGLFPFIIYINNNWDNYIICKYHLYADDTDGTRLHADNTVVHFDHIQKSPVFSWHQENSPDLNLRPSSLGCLVYIL